MKLQTPHEGKQFESSYGFIQAQLGRKYFRLVAAQAQDRRYVFTCTAALLRISEISLFRFISKAIGIAMLDHIPHDWIIERRHDRLNEYFENAYIIVKSPGGIRVLVCADPTWVPKQILKNEPMEICLLPYSSIELFLTGL